MATNYDDNREVTFEIVEEIGIIASSATGWTKELNVVAWNGGQGKYDIREWSPHHDRMSKGITLNEQEMRTIVDLLRRRERFVPRRGSISRGESRFDSSDTQMQTAGGESSQAASGQFDLAADEELGLMAGEESNPAADEELGLMTGEESDLTADMESGLAANRESEAEADALAS